MRNTHTIVSMQLSLLVLLSLAALFSCEAGKPKTQLRSNSKQSEYNIDNLAACTSTGNAKDFVSVFEGKQVSPESIFCAMASAMGKEGVTFDPYLADQFTELAYWESRGYDCAWNSCDVWGLWQVWEAHLAPGAICDNLGSSGQDLCGSWEANARCSLRLFYKDGAIFKYAWSSAYQVTPTGYFTKNNLSYPSCPGVTSSGYKSSSGQDGGDDSGYDLDGRRKGFQDSVSEEWRSDEGGNTGATGTGATGTGATGTGATGTGVAAGAVEPLDLADERESTIISHCSSDYYYLCAKATTSDGLDHYYSCQPRTQNGVHLPYTYCGSGHLPCLGGKCQ